MSTCKTPPIQIVCAGPVASLAVVQLPALARHEAWYALSGETCLETPAGTQVGRVQGPPVIVPGGLPMELTATDLGRRQHSFSYHYSTSEVQ